MNKEIFWNKANTNCVKVGGVYTHFKTGRKYIVFKVIPHNDTYLVFYFNAIDKDCEIEDNIYYCKDIERFTEKLDKNSGYYKQLEFDNMIKTKQEFRFELVE